LAGAITLPGSMGIAYRSDDASGCMFAVWDGNISGEDVEHHLLRLAEDPQFPPARQLQLTDITTMGRVTAPAPELIALLYEGTDLAAKMKVALVVHPSGFDAADRRYKSAAHSIRIAPFTDFASACAHLAILEATAQAACDELRCGLLER
jgi:hypothetical protein